MPLVLKTFKTFFLVKTRYRYYRIRTSIPPWPQTHTHPRGMHVVVVGRAQALPPSELPIPPPPAPTAPLRILCCCPLAPLCLLCCRPLAPLRFLWCRPLAPLYYFGCRLFAPSGFL